jgi:hypothetical protein
MKTMHDLELRREEFLVPQYTGRNILNLLASIIRAGGGNSPHGDLIGGPSVSDLREMRHIVYLVVDGVGVGQLQDLLHRGGGRAFFASRPFDILHTVCPATTAAAVTTFATGLSPAEHGILGWHLHLGDLGMVATILPAVTRTGAPMARADFCLGAYLRIPSRMAGIRRRRVLLSYGFIPRSRYSMAVGEWDVRASYKTLSGLVRQLLRVLRSNRPSVVYAYWPGYDSLCHECGCFHPRTLRHLQAIDRALARLARWVRGTGSCVFVTADHGLVDTPYTVDLAAIPEFMDCLALLPSGDARQVHCFVRPAHLARFDRVVRNRLSEACVCLDGAALLSARVFGPGRPHAALARRVGDRVLFARPGWAFGYTLPGAKPDFNRANHGGLAPQEVQVPLYTVRG